MRNGTVNWNKQVNDRIGEISMKSEGKRVDNFKYLWFDNLTEAAKIGIEAYQKEIEDFRNAYKERMKAPVLKTEEIKGRKYEL